MMTNGNTILITGGGSGIGRALAHAFYQLDNHVIVAGRRKAALNETTANHPGMRSYVFDVQDPASIRSFAQRVAAEHPALNVLVNNAGIMRAENLQAQPEDLADAEAMVATNLLGPMRLTAALMPVLRQQPRATIINVSSGLAFVPQTVTPTYSATKAALHSYTQSLRAQLGGTNLEVIELIPPGVQTDLMAGHGISPQMMPLADYINETMAILEKKANVQEVCVERVKALRFAEAQGSFDAVFNLVNASSH